MPAPKENIWNNSLKTSNIQNYLKNDFESEKELCNYIEKNAQLFSLDVLEIEYIAHEKEFYLGATNRVKNIGNLPHVDFMFKTTGNKIILVECKNPTNSYSELINSIGQLLSYYCIAKSNGLNVSRMCIISTKYTDRIRNIINEFSLPIEFYILTKSKGLKLIN